MQNLIFLIRLESKQLGAKSRAFQEYHRLNSESMLVLKKDSFVDKKGLMMTILSIKPLGKLAVDLICDKTLKRSYIMSLAERRLQQNLSLSKSYMLGEFNTI